MQGGFFTGKPIKSTIKSIEFFDHIADVLFEARGSSFAKALENAAKAMFQTIADTRRVKPSECFGVRVSASSREDLVVASLTELLVEGENRELFLTSFKVKTLEETAGGFNVAGEARGTPFDPKRGRVGVKAVTFHELSVRQVGGKWVVRVLLDI